ncbi:MAG TPA: hypothetical protein VLF79_02545 [Candidatus Saccharimonadales bacterium]|nr:hypothetical protein [Candidatus Saccharimonadales bacterium]
MVKDADPYTPDSGPSVPDEFAEEKLKIARQLLAEAIVYKYLSGEDVGYIIEDKTNLKE